MGYTLPEAYKLTRNPLMSGVLAAIVQYNELASVLRFAPKGGTSFEYNREKALPSIAWIPDSGVTTEESAATFDRVTVPMRRLVANVDVDQFAADMGLENADEAIQVAKKAKAAWHDICRVMIVGGNVTGHTLSVPAATPALAIDAIAYGPFLDSGRYGPGTIKYTHVGTLWQFRAPGDIAYGPTVAAVADGTFRLRSDNPNKYIDVTLDVSDATADGVTEITFTSSTNEPDGLNKLIDPAQLVASVGAAGDDLAFATFDRLISKVKVGSAAGQAFVMNDALHEKYYALHRALGGTQPPTLTLPGYTGPVPVYRGRPILRNDQIPSTEVKGALSTGTSLYLVNLADEEGFWAGAASLNGTFTPEGDPRSRPVLGFRMEPVGTLEGKDARRQRVKWYGAFALGSPLAAARASELKTA